MMLILSVLGFAAAVTAQGIQWIVNVAPNGTFAFDPPNTPGVANGDIMTFMFVGEPGNHTVSQASFDTPCAQMANGFDSGFVPVAMGAATTPVWNLTVTDASKPIYFYCKQTAGPKGPHCLAGMVGAINAPTNGTGSVDAFMSAAKALASLPSQAAGSLKGVGASATASPTAAAGATSGATGSSGSSPTAPPAAGSAPSATPASAAFQQATFSIGAAISALVFGVALCVV